MARFNEKHTSINKLNTVILFEESNDFETE